MDLIERWRSEGLEVPNVDPNDGGVNAMVLFLLETPGPRAVGTQFVSRDNPDPSARNMGRLLDQAGFARADVVLWNVVPQCISTADRNKRPTKKQIKEAASKTQDFINALPRLKVVIFCGVSAKTARAYLIPAHNPTIGLKTERIWKKHFWPHLPK